MTLSKRINILSYLGAYLQKGSEELEAVIQKTYFHNRWFTTENTKVAIETVSQNFLDKDLLESWANKYAISDKRPMRRVGLVLDGNTPLTGFHDLISIFISGNIAKIKLSETDKFLIPHFVKVMAEVEEEVNTMFEVSERLSELDAVIVRGNQKSIRYFKTYFGKYPNIIEEQKNTIAILDGKESQKDLELLGDDIFKYFGLGQRNVSKLYLPESFDFENLLEILHEHRDLVNHDKYKNNFDYNYTLLILNSRPLQSNGCILLTEDTALQSRIAQLHYEFYKDESDLKTKLDAIKDQIEITLGNSISNLQLTPFGKSQYPGLFDYIGGVDTMAFLTALEK